jgi:hypothetical protein
MKAAEPSRCPPTEFAGWILSRRWVLSPVRIINRHASNRPTTRAADGAFQRAPLPQHPDPEQTTVGPLLHNLG